MITLNANTDGYSKVLNEQLINLSEIYDINLLQQKVLSIDSPNLYIFNINDLRCNNIVVMPFVWCFTLSYNAKKFFKNLQK